VTRVNGLCAAGGACHECVDTSPHALVHIVGPLASTTVFPVAGTPSLAICQSCCNL